MIIVFIYTQIFNIFRYVFVFTYLPLFVFTLHALVWCIGIIFSSSYSRCCCNSSSSLNLQKKEHFSNGVPERNKNMDPTFFAVTVGAVKKHLSKICCESALAQQLHGMCILVLLLTASIPMTVRESDGCRQRHKFYFPTGYKNFLIHAIKSMRTVR